MITSPGNLMTKPMGTIFKRPEFRIDKDAIKITNYRSSWSLRFLTLAVACLFLPFVRPDERSFALGLLLAAFFLSLACHWSEVVIGLAKDQVELTRRFGLFTSSKHWQLSSFKLVVLWRDDEGNTEVYLEPGTMGGSSEIVGREKSIVWGRSHSEAEEIAVAIAAHLNLPLEKWPVCDA